MITIPHLPCDERLPRLAEAMNPQTMTSVFQKSLLTGTQDHASSRIQSCEINHVRYKHGRYCLVGYTLRIEDRRTHDVTEQWIYGRIFPPGESHKRYEKCREHCVVSPTIGRPIFHIPQYEMCCLTFPNDRKLPGLSRAFDWSYLKHQSLPAILDTIRDPEWELDDCSRSIVQYVPEHTCTLRIPVQLFHRSLSHPQPHCLFAKIYADERGAEIFDAMRRLWNSDAHTKGQFTLPKPVWHDKALHVLWQETLEGIPLGSYDWHDPHLRGLYHNVGKAVASLHQTSLPGLSSVGPSNGMTDLQSATRLLAGMRPTCRSLLDDITDHLHLSMPKLIEGPPVTLHRDLHRKNIFIHHDKVGFIDWDSIIQGPALIDIGSFVARMYYPVAIGELSESLAIILIEQFLHGYRRHVPWPVRSSEVAWHTALCLVTQQAYSCATRFRSGKLETIDYLLHHAAVLARHLHKPLTIRQKLDNPLCAAI